MTSQEPGQREFVDTSVDAEAQHGYCLVTRFHKGADKRVGEALRVDGGAGWL